MTMTETILEETMIDELEKLIDYTEVDNSDNSIDVSMCWGFCVSCSAQCENDASD